jgi:hypothetical protein
VTTFYRSLTHRDWCPKSITVSTSCFLATDFNIGTITVLLNYTLQILHIKSSLHSRTFNWVLLKLTLFSVSRRELPNDWVRVLSLMLWPTDSRPVCLGLKQQSGDYDQISITVSQLGGCWCGRALSDRGRVCRLQLLLALAREVILGSESLGTRYHILLSQIRDFPFRRLLRRAGLLWRYATLHPHGIF